MFNLTNQPPWTIHSVQLNRQGIGLNAVTSVLFLMVFVKTLTNSRMTLLLTVSSIMAFGYFLGIFNSVLYNWV